MNHPTQRVMFISEDGLSVLATTTYEDGSKETHKVNYAKTERGAKSTLKREVNRLGFDLVDGVYTKTF